MSDRVESEKRTSMDSTKDCGAKPSTSKLLEEFLNQDKSARGVATKITDCGDSNTNISSYALPSLTLVDQSKPRDAQPSANRNDTTPKQGTASDANAKPGNPGGSKNTDATLPPNVFRTGDTPSSVLQRMGKSPAEATKLAADLAKQTGKYSFQPGDCLITAKDGSVRVLPDADLDKAIDGYLKTHAGKQPDYTSLVNPGSRFVFSENTTHLLDPDGPKDLMNLMDQLSKANPPAKALGLEMFPTDMQHDLNSWMKNPNATSKDGKPLEKLIQDDIKAVIKKGDGNITDPVKDAAAKAGKTPEEYLTDQFMSVLKEARKDHMQVVCLDLPDSITKVTSAPPGTQSPLVSALSSLVDTKGPQGQGLLDLYQHGNPQEQQQARQGLLNFLTNNPPSKQGTVADHQNEANDLLKAMDTMKKLGFDFSSGSKDMSLDQSGKLDTNRLSEYLMVGFRSKTMSDVAAKSLNSIPDKGAASKPLMIISVGSAHVGFDDPNSIYGQPDPTMSDILKKDYRLDSTSIKFNNGSSHSTSEIDPQLHQSFLRDDPQGKPFVVKLDQLPPYSTGQPRPFDYYVELGASTTQPDPAAP